ncbi:hypothetical protein JVU11DRAFT_7759 [Chiua virens]|nr:hypothetical protein JVU11DRAFT_7759 [Chiua virens]
MSVAGPSRVRAPGRLARESITSTYEDDLQGLLNQLSLDEMDEMETFFTQRASAGERLSDHDLAMNDLLQQARALAFFNEDRILAERIANGEDVEEAPRVPVIPRATGNRMTVNLGRNSNQRVQVPSTTESQTWGRWLSSVVVDWFTPKKLESGTITTNTNTLATPAVNNRYVLFANGIVFGRTTNLWLRPASLTGHDCVICQDPIRGAEIRAPCGHYYDIECITDLFQSATRDETLYPPRCCRQNIPLLKFDLTSRKRSSRWSSKNRPRPLSEGAFSSKIYTCPAPGCGKQTCGKCRVQHSGDWTHVCRPDADATQVLELSRASGWARCPGCSQMIELHIGCFHMTCRCRTEFCYLCLAHWKTCQCPQWDERRLLTAAEERVDAQLGRGQGRGVQRNVEPVHRVPPVPVLAPPPLPARPFAYAPAENAPANRARVAAPATVTRPAEPTLTVAATQQSLVQQSRSRSDSVRAVVNAVHSGARSTTATTPAVPARTPTYTVASASASTSRSTPVVPTRTSMNFFPLASASTSRSTPAVPTRTSTNPFASTSTSTATSATPTASTSRPGWAPQPKPTSNVDTIRQQMVREMMERLRDDHECDHVGRWRYRNGGGICQSCGHHLPKYLFRVTGADGIVCEEQDSLRVHSLEQGVYQHLIFLRRFIKLPALIDSHFDREDHISPVVTR